MTICFASVARSLRDEFGSIGQYDSRLSLIVARAVQHRHGMRQQLRDGLE